MARSAEKKMTALARWRAVYEDRISYKERPKLASECNDLKDALGFRRSIVSEITKKIAQVQNSSLGEFKLRDLNDEINRLIRERRHWENRIVELGGSEKHRSYVLPLEKEGKSLGGSDGYRYFGAVRELPGVRELFHNDVEPPVKKVRKDLSLHFYGLLDEADGVLLKLENDEESRKKYIDSWRKTNKKEKSKQKLDDDEKETVEKDDDDVVDIDNDVDSAIYVKDEIFEAMRDNIEEETTGTVIGSNISDFEARVKRFSHVEVPSKEEVERAVVSLKKDKILQDYMSEELMQDLVSSGTLLGHEAEAVATLESSTSEQITDSVD